MDKSTQFKTSAEFTQASPAYQVAIRKLVISHAINELHGARVFDEPAVAYAPNPYAKWLTCRVAMEEYGHHCRFFELGKEIGIPDESMLPEKTSKKPLSMFEFPLESWEEFVAIKMLGDLAEILQVEDLLHCTFHPLRNLARMTMPEEKFHHQFGVDFARELVKDPVAKAKLQAAVNRVFPFIPSFFGRTGSKNNQMYRDLGIKLRTNEEMRADYLARAKAACDLVGLNLPDYKEPVH
ncbi:MAG: Phenylacetic acid catabolic protein [Burkholderiales bacterium]